MKKLLIFLLFMNHYLFQISCQSTFYYNADYETKIDSLLQLMTLEEKINMLHGNELFSSLGVKRLNIPDLKYTDGPLGIREEQLKDRFASAGHKNDSATFFPTGEALAATWNTELAYKYGVAMAQEARARNKDILLAPAVNIMRTPLCGRNYEYFGEDPFLASRIVVPYIKGVQDQNVAACVKHFALNNQETERSYVSVETDERTLREIYLPAFKSAVEEAEVYSVMGAYNKFRQSYLCENEYLLNKILKNEWGFKGIVISDWNATHSTVKSALNGLDIEMGTRIEGGYENYYFARPLLDSVKAGKVDEKVIDEKIRRILRVMYNCKMFDPEREKGSINTPEISEVVYKTASEAIVLLKNDKKLLPVNKTNLKSIAIIGHNSVQKHAKGGFGAGVKARYEITPLKGLENELTNSVQINYAVGYVPKYNRIEVPGSRPRFVADNKPDSALVVEAVECAAISDIVILFAGANREYESEARDRPDMKLPFGQYELIKAVSTVNPNTIVVITGGAPYELTEIQKYVSSIVWSWFNGSEGGNALADVLFGKINPSGKLPFTIPALLDDSPAHALKAFPGENGTVEYKEGILTGYRWFDTKKIEPSYCFGHGLSYSDFEYSDLRLNKKKYEKDDSIYISLKIKNTGNYNGDEVVQVYVKNTNSKVLHPEKELKAFKKIHLNKGKELKVELTIHTEDLAWFNEKTMSWKVDEAEYEIIAGSSSRDIRLKGNFSIK